MSLDEGNEQKIAPSVCKDCMCSCKLRVHMCENLSAMSAEIVDIQPFCWLCDIVIGAVFFESASIERPDGLVASNGNNVILRVLWVCIFGFNSLCKHIIICTADCVYIRRNNHRAREAFNLTGAA